MTSGRSEPAPGGADWARVEEIFHATADLPADDRRELIERASEGDATLAAQVERLVRADQSQASLFSGLGPRVAEAAVEMLGTMTHGAASAWIGRSVGPYRVGEPLGEGGMGTVYRAVREDVGKEVALKIVRGSLRSPEILRRFLLERRVLARLVHPAIARLLDAGTTDEGTPWLVMDLVDGRPITRYCNEHALDPTARLRSFLQVCDAVAYAHARLVVHRDIKPSNVFVDESGQVKLLDFGNREAARRRGGCRRRDPDGPVGVLTRVRRP